MRTGFLLKESAYNPPRDQVLDKYPDLQELRRQQQMKKLIQEISILKAMRRSKFEDGKA